MNINRVKTLIVHPDASKEMFNALMKSDTDVVPAEKLLEGKMIKFIDTIFIAPPEKLTLEPWTPPLHPTAPYDAPGRPRHKKGKR